MLGRQIDMEVSNDSTFRPGLHSEVLPNRLLSLATVRPGRFFIKGASVPKMVRQMLIIES